MKKWFIRILILVISVMVIFCCMGMEVTCDGEFQGLSCSFDGCTERCTESCADSCRNEIANSCNGCGQCNHDFKKIGETESTCIEAGYIEYRCKKCGEIDIQYKNLIYHDFTYSFHRGDCSTGGDHDWYEQDECSTCGYVEKNPYFSGYALHYYDEGKIELYDDGSGCGEIVYTCLICGETKTENYHSEESPQLQEAIENKQNSTLNGGCSAYLKTCELCNHTVVEEWHNYEFEEILVAPTQTEYGLARIRCHNIVFNGYCGLMDGTEYYLLPPYGNVN